MCVFILCVSLAMEFHEKLQSLAVKEGLKGRKVTRALESFSWNITILKVSNPHTHTHTPPIGAGPLDHSLPLAICSSKFALVTFILHLLLLPCTSGLQGIV